ncbi:MAG: hypothetical protein K0U79_00900 [Gammaproteobacteria bacterium]|nr:hypothetical protein [Gammaproteobacteria bacterium]
MSQVRGVQPFTAQHRAKLTVRQSGGQRDDLAFVAEREPPARRLARHFG